MDGYAPRARGNSMRPRRLLGASGRPLNFTVRCHGNLVVWPLGCGMSPRSYWVHLSVAILFFVAVLVSVANDILQLGFFSRGARMVSAVTILAFVL